MSNQEVHECLFYHRFPQIKFREEFSAVIEPKMYSGILPNLKCNFCTNCVPEQCALLITHFFFLNAAVS